ncbi:MAG: hypothetical protein ACYS1A_01920 [Planctomycetota bacterium]|jgi:hypothetical protein
MTEKTTNSQISPEKRLSQWFFNPFRFIAGFRALLLGLAIILLSAFFGWLGTTHFDGVLDFHTGLQASLWFFFAEGLINWVSLVIPLFFFGLIVSRFSFRIVDVLGTQALARWPYLITALVMLPDANRRFAEYMMSRFGLGAAVASINYVDMLIFAFAMLLSILMAVWMVALMYKAYAVSCNIKGAKTIITFIISLLGAEVLSKFVILQMLSRFG